MQTIHRSPTAGGLEPDTKRDELPARGQTLQVGALYGTPWSLSLKRHDMAQLKCVSGRLWVTQEGQITDIILQPGEVSEVSGPGLLLVSGLPNGSFCLATRPTVVKRGK